MRQPVNATKPKPAIGSIKTSAKPNRVLAVNRSPSWYANASAHPIRGIQAQPVLKTSVPLVPMVDATVEVGIIARRHGAAGLMKAAKLIL